MNYQPELKPQRTKIILPLHKFYTKSDKADGHLFLNKNIYDIIADETVKRRLLLSPILMDVAYQVLSEYKKTYTPKFTEKMLFNKAFQYVQEYHKNVFDNAPFLTELLLDNMEEFGELTKQHVAYINNAAYMHYSKKPIPNLVAKKVSLISVAGLAVRYAMDNLDLFREVCADEEMNLTLKSLDNLASYLFGKAEFDSEMTKNDKMVLDTSVTIFTNKLMDFLMEMDIV